MIVLLIAVFLLVVGLWYFKMYKNVGKKVAEQNVPVVKVDSPPISEDTIIDNTEKIGVIELTKSNLSYHDIDGDPITKVRFVGNNNLFYDKTLLAEYVNGTELDIEDFKLYCKVDLDKGVEVIKYSVFANNKWSNE